MNTVKIGIIGCGNISGQYLKGLGQFPILEIAAAADLIAERSEKVAKEVKTARACTVEQLLADKSIQIVVNLTIPKVHGEVAMQVIGAGKHVYNEKPLALDRAEGKRLLDAAKKKGVRVGGAPDTFMGAGIQACRKLVDEGALGDVVAGSAYMLCGGHEGWHPAPEFYYKVGGGPMLDMGPYYLTALVQLLGPIKSVAGAARITRPTRTIGSQPLKGTVIQVETPDHVAGVVEFASDAIVTIATSFATPVNTHAPITLFGSKATLVVPDPNGFDGVPQLVTGGKDRPRQDVKHVHMTGYLRGVGVADMAYAIQSGRPHRASGEQCYMVLDAMQGLLESAKTGKRHTIEAQAPRTASLPAGLAAGELDK